MIAPLLLSMAMVQGPSPLAKAESLLVAGDTIKAIALLRGVPIDLKKPSDEAVAATMAILWIGRFSHADEVRQFAQEIVDSVKRDDEFFPTLLQSPGRRSMLWALAIEYWAQPLPVPATLTKLGDRRVLTALAIDSLRSVLTDSLPPQGMAAGAARNVIGQYELRVLIDRLREAMPTSEWSPSQCRQVEGVCAVREGGSFDGPALRTWMESDVAIRGNLARARALFTDALEDPWPFGAMALQSLTGIDLLFGNDSTLLALEPRVREVGGDTTTTLRLEAMLLALGGRPDSAHALMDRHRGLFAALDTVVGPLEGRLKGSPAALWRTGWPLYLEPFNERLVVHRGRVIAAGLLPGMTSRLANVDDFATPADVIRRGMARRLERQPGRSKKLIAFVSARTQETLLPAIQGSNSAIDLDLSLAARARSGAPVLTGFVPRFYEYLRDLPHQAMQYQRSGQAFVDFFAQPPPISDSRCQYETGFFLQGSDLRLLRRSRDTLPTGRAPALHYSIPVAPGAYVYSVEVRDTTCRVAARARYAFGAQLPQLGLAISDVLLAAGNESFDPKRVSGAIPVAGRAGLEVAVSEPVSLYWEIYGVKAAAQDADRLAIEIDAVDVRRGKVSVTTLGEVQERADRAKADATVRYTTNVPPGDGPLGMALTVKIPAVAGAVCRVRVIVTDLRTNQKATGTRTFYVRSEP